MGVVKLYVPCGSEDEARSLGTTLLEHKYVACATILPGQSLYWWNNKIEDEREHILLCTTNDVSIPRARKHIENHHSYEVPCILSFPVEANEPYTAWVSEVVDQ